MENNTELPAGWMEAAEAAVGVHLNGGNGVSAVAPKEPPPEVTEPTDPGKKPEAVPPEPTEPEVTEPDPAVEEAAAAAADPVLKKRLDLLARRDARDREKRQAEDAALEAKRKEIASLSAQAQDRKRMEVDALTDPIGFLKSFGVKIDADLAKRTYAETLGDAAPPDVKLAAQGHEIRTLLHKQAEEIRELREHIESQKREVETQRLVTQYQADIKAHLATVKDAPLVQAFYADKPDRILGELVGMQSRYAQEYGELMPFDELIAAYEDALDQELPAAIKAAVRGQKTTPPKASETKAAATVSTRELASPTKPRAKATTWDEERQEAIKLLEDYTRTGQLPPE